MSADAIIRVGGETIIVRVGGDLGVPIPAPLGNEGKFLTVGVGGDLEWASGTGADAGLRTDLATTGASLVAFNARRTVAAKLGDVLSAKDYGALGDNGYHPLSSLYGSLAAAQAAFPLCTAAGYLTALTQTADWAGIQEALLTAALTTETRGAVFVPRGLYQVYGTLKKASNVTIYGESDNGTRLYSVGFAGPMFANADPNTYHFGTIRNLVVLGATHVLKIDVAQEQSGLLMDHVIAVQQTVAHVETNYLQTSAFRDCTFNGSDGASPPNALAAYGIHCTGTVCNSILVENTRLIHHTDASLSLATCNGFKWLAGSMEGSGTAGDVTIDVTDATALSFDGLYVESRHEYLLKARGTCHGISFANCSLMGRLNIGQPENLSAFSFDCEARPIQFWANYFRHATTGPGNTVAIGQNDNLAAPLMDVASAASITLPDGQQFVRVTGTTNITSITAGAANTGRVVTLAFSDVMTVVDGSNLKLASNFVASGDDCLTLACNGTNWYEAGRSAN